MVDSIRPRPHARELIGAQTVVPTSTEAAPSSAFFEAARRRLRAALGVVVGALVIYLVLYSTVWVSLSAPIPYGATVVGLLVGFGCLVALRQGEPTRERLVTIGLVFQASLACVIATIDAHEVPAGIDEPAGLISWNCANILLVPMLVPVRSRNVLAITGALACATPIALFVLPRIAGTTQATSMVFWSMTMPPFLCAAMAYFPSTVLESLHREVAQARRLGAYDLAERIGAGGMGEVWRATHRLLARPAAIKLVRPEIIGEAAERKALALARFEREAKVTAALESPHTVELYDFGVAEDGTLYYVMELLCGLDLALLVERFGPLPPERVVYLLLQVCDSLEEAHRAGLVHRDIKPANVFVSRRADHFDWIKVLDFGLVRPSERAVRDRNALLTTAAGQITGTPAFLAPEAATGEGELDGRADLYALGCVAYFALTGAFLFDADSPMAMAIQQVTVEPKPPSERLGTTLPKELEEVVLACLAKKPADRPASAKALAARLRAIRFDEPWTEERAARFWHDHLPEHFHA
jgi:serine/threonine-protein kinase